MKLTNGEIFNAREPLATLMGMKLPLKTSYGLAKIASKLGAQLGIIETCRKGLFMTYGTPDPKRSTSLIMLPEIEQKDEDGKVIVDAEGKPVMVPNPQFPKFATEMGELMMQEVEIVIEKVTLPDTLEIEPATLMKLEKFIKV